ncbi:MAG: undecaprenyl/decaprenyl-phosphate alpha-N-acetylglucosaminyl 1-phosphate transferase [Myxococcales bacterium]|nr:MAG: undecaprenyl/decaprenyl-phosphate alpha-N-acetylglucosaminyl 1-phosphate transferase [Myxococcales bacterium]
MTNAILITLAFLLALALSLYFVPVMRRAAIKWGVLDKPDGRLKKQREPVPYLGGIAVYIAFLLSISLLYDYSPQVIGLLLAGTIMLLIGLVDDFGVLLPYQKLAGQILATFVLIKAGIYIRIEAFPLWVAMPLTVVWMLGVINAVNIIDIADGLSSGVGLVAALALMAVAILNGNVTIAFLTAALAGSILGFLAYNFHPAKIYLGDAGSLFIGLMLGALSMVGDYSLNNPLAYIAPALILGVPLFDTAFVMLMRAKKGLPVFLGSPDHFAIRLMRKRHWSARRVAIASYVVSAILGGLAILNMRFTPEFSLALAGVLAIGVVAATIWFNGMDRDES